jgi:hypothetical protein
VNKWVGGWVGGLGVWVGGGGAVHVAAKPEFTARGGVVVVVVQCVLHEVRRLCVGGSVLTDGARVGGFCAAPRGVRMVTRHVFLIVTNKYA